jgi:hypothetical protein
MGADKKENSSPIHVIRCGGFAFAAIRGQKTFLLNCILCHLCLFAIFADAFCNLKIRHKGRLPRERPFVMRITNFNARFPSGVHEHVAPPRTGLMRASA